ncbi:MAG: efflux RND transporter permease subunit [Planctomycetaceae bacterium]|nr:efflux RND transporter permease subunit [Planctomycetaceae bacterium]
MIITDAAIKNRTTIMVMILLIIVAGVYSYMTLPRESFPDVQIPKVLVTTTYEGVSPEDVETSVTMKLEDKLAGLKGLKEMRSSSAEGMSLISLEFYPEIVIDDALQYVRDRVDLAKPDLPAVEERKEPTITEINLQEMPILMINVSGDPSPARLKVIADRLQDEMEKIPGVMECQVIGARVREIRVEIDPDRLAAYGLSIPEVMQLIPSENVNVSAGGLETKGMRFNIRVPAEFRKPEEVDLLPVATRDGRTIYLSDVASIHDTFRDRDTYSRLNGAESITVAVKKRAGANIIDITDTAKVVLDHFRASVPLGVTFQITMDQSDHIRSMISDLENNIFTGLVLVVLVLMVFMGLRTSLIVSTIIPLSMLLSFAVIQMLGYTLNMMILFGLIMSLGMLVDNAIVIVENIYRHMQIGYTRIEAARRGTAEVAWPVITSTLTTLAAFAPLMFWPGIMGSFMKYLPICLIITLLCSLAVALVINPTICSMFGGGVKCKIEAARRDPPIIRAYRWALGKALAHRRVTLGGSFLILALTIVAFGFLGHGVQLFPDTEPRNALVKIRAPQGTNINETNRIALEVEKRIKPHWKEHELEYMVSNVGSPGNAISAALTGESSGPHAATLTLQFLKFEDRKKDSTLAINAMREYLADIPGVELVVEKPQNGPPTGAAVTVRFIGEDFKKLSVLAAQGQAMIADVNGLASLTSDYEAARPELRMKVDRRRAARLGVNSRVIGNFLKTAIFGSKVGIYRQFNDEYDITIRLPESQRSRIQDTLRLRVPASGGKPVPLSSLGEFTYAGGFGTISRVAQKRVITLSGDAQGRLSTEVLAEVQQRLGTLGRQTLRYSDVKDWRAFAQAMIAPKGFGGRLLATAAGKRADLALALRALAGEPAARSEMARRMAADHAQAKAEAPRTQPATSPAVPGDQAIDAFCRDAALKAVNAALTTPGVVQAADMGKTEQDDAERKLLAAGKLSKDDVLRLNRKALTAALPGLVGPPDRLVVDEGYRVSYAGEEEERQNALGFLLKAFIFALIFITLILVIQFNTISIPMIIMVTVLLSLEGVLIGLMATATPFSIIMTGIGVISLAGIVVNNAIVLLDYTRQLQKQGKELIEATIEAGATRLRPVFLTAITTLLGLVPTAMGMGVDLQNLTFATKSESSQFWRPMAVSIIFGLGIATVLTLIVVPALYVSFARLSERFFWGGGLKKAGDDSQAELEKEDY